MSAPERAGSRSEAVLSSVALAVLNTLILLHFIFFYIRVNLPARSWGHLNQGGNAHTFQPFLLH